jgi:hypothetical protein
MHNGKHVQSLSNQEYNTHKLKPGHSYDYSEFRDADKFHRESKPIKPMLAKMKRLHARAKMNPGSRVIMATARADFDDKHKFLDRFHKDGVEVHGPHRIHVYRAGNMEAPMSVAERKAAVLRKHLQEGGYTEAHLHDDSKENLNAFLKLKKEFPNTKFHAHHVQHDGSSVHHTEEF